MTTASVIIQFADFLRDMASKLEHDEVVGLVQINTEGLSTVFMGLLSKIVDWLREESLIPEDETLRFEPDKSEIFE